jgi:DNA-binding transcriptional regulator YiaG
MSDARRLVDAVDELLAGPGQPDLPAPVERVRLRKAAKLTQRQVAAALGVRVETIWTWEKGRTEPRPPRRAAYAHLLQQIADRLADEPRRGE